MIINTKTKSISYVTIIFILGVIVVYLLNFAHPYGDLNLEIESLKNNQKEVIKFYDIFETVSVVPYHFDRYNSITGKDTGGKWRIAFDSQHDGQRHLLEVFYFAWVPSDIIYTCFDLQTNTTKILSKNTILENMNYNC